MVERSKRYIDWNQRADRLKPRGVEMNLHNERSCTCAFRRFGASLLGMWFGKWKIDFAPFSLYL